MFISLPQWRYNVFTPNRLIAIANYYYTSSIRSHDKWQLECVSAHCSIAHFLVWYLIKNRNESNPKNGAQTTIIIYCCSPLNIQYFVVTYRVRACVCVIAGTWIHICTWFALHLEHVFVFHRVLFSIAFRRSTKRSRCMRRPIERLNGILSIYACCEIDNALLSHAHSKCRCQNSWNDKYLPFCFVAKSTKVKAFTDTLSGHQDKLQLLKFNRNDDHRHEFGRQMSLFLKNKNSIFHFLNPFVGDGDSRFNSCENGFRCSS